MRKIAILTLSITSAAAIAARRFVGFDDAQVGAAGAPALGVSDYAASGPGKQIAVIVEGTAPIEAGAAFNRGALVMSDAQGRAVPHTGANSVQGRALEAAAGAGSMPEILLLPSRTAIA